MLELEKVMELKIHNKQGQSMKAIARVSGAARNTVRKYVRDSATAVRKARVSRLDLHRDWLTARLSQSPGIPASVLRRELDEGGCTIGGARLRDVVAKLRPKRPAPPVVRFETAPGVQAQVDFATMSFGEFSFKLFVAVLGWAIRAGCSRFLCLTSASKVYEKATSVSLIDWAAYRTKFFTTIRKPSSLSATRAQTKSTGFTPHSGSWSGITALHQPYANRIGRRPKAKSSAWCATYGKTSFCRQ